MCLHPFSVLALFSLKKRAGCFTFIMFCYFMFVVFEFGFLLGVLLNSFLFCGLNGYDEQRREYIWINLKTG